MFNNSTGWSVGYWNDFETELEYNNWMNDRLSDGLVYVGEEEKKVETYPQVLRLDLKSPGNSYFTLIERFESSEEYVKYCDWKLSQGFKVIGSEPYKLDKNEAN